MADESDSLQINLGAPTKAGRSVEYWIDPQKALVVMRLGKTLEATEIELYARALRQDPRFRPTLAEIVDLRNVQLLQMTPSQAITLADRADPFAMSARRAFVVSNDYQANLAQMHKMLRSPSKCIRIFESFAEAEAWVRSGAPCASPAGPPRILHFPVRHRS